MRSPLFMSRSLPSMKTRKHGWKSLQDRIAGALDEAKRTEFTAVQEKWIAYRDACRRHYCRAGRAETGIDRLLPLPGVEQT